MENLICVLRFSASDDLFLFRYMHDDLFVYMFGFMQGNEQLDYHAVDPRQHLHGGKNLPRDVYIWNYAIQLFWRTYSQITIGMDPPVIVFSSACAGLAGGAAPALAQLVSSSCHAAMSSSLLLRSAPQDASMHKTRSSSLLGQLFISPNVPPPMRR